MDAIKKPISENDVNIKENTAIYSPIETPKVPFNDENARKIGFEVSSKVFSWSSDKLLPLKGDSTIHFYADAKSDLMVGITSQLNSKLMYEVVIGADFNTRSYVRRVLDNKIICSFEGVFINKKKYLNRFSLKIEQYKNIMTLKESDDELFICEDNQFIPSLRYYSMAAGNQAITFFNVHATANIQTFKRPKPVVVYTPSGFGIYDGWKESWSLPSKGEGAIIFSTPNKRDIIVGVSDRTTGDTDIYYEINIGVDNNTRTTITKGHAETEVCSVNHSIKSRNDIVNLLILFHNDLKKIELYIDGILILGCVDKNYLSTVKYYDFTSLEGDLKLYYVGSVKRSRNVKLYYTENKLYAAGTFNVTKNETNVVTRKNITSKKVVLNSKGERVVTSTTSIRPILSTKVTQSGTNISTESLGFTTSKDVAPKWNPNNILPENGLGAILFTAVGESDIHVILSPKQSLIQPYYNIIIGAYFNTRSIIMRNGKIVCEDNNPVYKINEVNTYTIKVQGDENKITIYQNGIRTFRCIDEQFIKSVRYFTFTSDNPVDYFNVRIGARSRKNTD